MAYPVKNTEFYSIPAGPGDLFFFSERKKRLDWANCYYLQYIHASVRSLNDLPICHVGAKSHVLQEIFAKAQNASCAIPRQSLAKYYY